MRVLMVTDPKTTVSVTEAGTAEGARGTSAAGRNRSADRMHAPG